MKKSMEISILALLLFVFLNYVDVHAANEEDLTPTFKMILSTSISSFHYNQPSMGKSDGNFAGVFLSGTFHLKSIMISAELEHIFGNPLYEGRLYSYENDSLVTTDITRTTNYDRITEIRLLSGLDFISNNRLLTPFLGVAFYRWRGEFSGDDSYRKSPIYYYAPIGMQVTLPVDQKWSCMLRLEYDLIFSGNVKTHLSEGYSDSNDPENRIKFGDAYGLRFSADFKAKVTQGFKFVFQPYVIYWKVHETDSTTAKYGDQRFEFNEPESDITQYGIRIGLEF